MRVRIKVCGVTTAEAARAAVESGVDALGFVFAESPRRLEISRALEIASVVPPFVTRVAVFRHPAVAEVADVLSQFRPHLVQVEPADHLAELLGDGRLMLPVFHDKAGVVHEVERFVATTAALPGVHFEAAGRGGRGVLPDWDRAAQIARHAPLVLAGGLTPDNVAEGIRRVRPWAVDVSSGVESAPGIKDAQLVRRFVEAVKQAQDRQAEVDR
jgi:phosphoribosylanthranilate isomerase